MIKIEMKWLMRLFHSVLMVYFDSVSNMAVVKYINFSWEMC